MHQQSLRKGKVTRHPEDSIYGYVKLYNQPARDFPGGPVIKNPPASEGVPVRSLVLEAPTFCGAAKAVPALLDHVL